MIAALINTLRPRQNGRHLADDTFNRVFVNEYVRISIKFSLKFVPKGPINNIPALVQIMAWRRPGDRPLSEPVMVNPMTHICVTRPQWVKLHLLPVKYSTGFEMMLIVYTGFHGRTLRIKAFKQSLKVNTYDSISSIQVWCQLSFWSYIKLAYLSHRSF